MRKRTDAGLREDRFGPPRRRVRRFRQCHDPTRSPARPRWPRIPPARMAIRASLQALLALRHRPAARCRRPRRTGRDLEQPGAGRDRGVGQDTVEPVADGASAKAQASFGRASLAGSGVLPEADDRATDAGVQFSLKARLIPCHLPPNLERRSIDPEHHVRFISRADRACFRHFIGPV